MMRQEPSWRKPSCVRDEERLKVTLKSYGLSPPPLCVSKGDRVRV